MIKRFPKSIDHEKPTYIAVCSNTMYYAIIL